jgi:hypothetical protein
VQRAFVKQDALGHRHQGAARVGQSRQRVAALGIIGAEIRWNAWLNRAEIKGSSGRVGAIDDVVIAKLKMRFLRTGTRFRVGDEFLETLLWPSRTRTSIRPRHRAHQWARLGPTPRLVTWLSYTCGVPCDPYHQAVGKNVIGGMVKRARRPAPSTTK